MATSKDIRELAKKALDDDSRPSDWPLYSVNDLHNHAQTTIKIRLTQLAELKQEMIHQSQEAQKEIDRLNRDTEQPIEARKREIQWHLGHKWATDAIIGWLSDEE